MTLVQQIIQRLNDRCDSLKHVKGFAELQALTKMPAGTTAYVKLSGRTARANSGASYTRQAVQVRIGITIIHVNRSDRRGEAASHDLEAITSDVQAALLGWQPEGADNGMTYGGGELLSFDTGTAIQEETYDVQTTIMEQVAMSEASA